MICALSRLTKTRKQFPDDSVLYRMLHALHKQIHKFATSHTPFRILLNPPYNITVSNARSVSRLTLTERFTDLQLRYLLDRRNYNISQSNSKELSQEQQQQREQLIQHIIRNVTPEILSVSQRKFPKAKTAIN